MDSKRKCIAQKEEEIPCKIAKVTEDESGRSVLDKENSTDDGKVSNHVDIVGTADESNMTAQQAIENTVETAYQQDNQAPSVVAEENAAEMLNDNQESNEEQTGVSETDSSTSDYVTTSEDDFDEEDESDPEEGSTRRGFRMFCTIC